MNKILNTCPTCGNTFIVNKYAHNKIYCSGKCWQKSPKAKVTAKIGRRKRRVIDPRKELLRRAKYRAKKKELEFSLRLEDIIVPEYCPVLGIKLQLLENEMNSSPSLDRIDNTKGYTKDNILVISYRANTLKRDATKEELKKISEYYT